ncbi:MAG: LysR family transcriptional regulator, partial [Rhizobiaceae bacterium]|nr:LysR family transcriptional regulator [Rhizobiaceae bacterium]
KSDPTLDYIDLMSVDLVPVAASTLLPGLSAKEITPSRLQPFVQCVIRDTARHSQPRDSYVLKGARHLTVSDQLMKKQVILNGMGWGHMPLFLVEDEIRNGLLVDFTNADFQGGRIDLAAARRRDRPHGPAANRLWDYVTAEAPRFRQAEFAG